MFEDRVSCIRQAAINQIKFFIENKLFKNIEREIFELAKKFIANKDNYLLRSTGLYTL